MDTRDNTHHLDHSHPPKASLAIIGSGIAGLGCAYFLQHRFNITLLERNDYVGGHTHTVSVRETEKGSSVRFDTGFMVYTEATYPNLTRLFNVLDVKTQPTDMSFSVQVKDQGLEWSGASWSRLFGQRKNILNLRYWRMLLQLNRFNREAQIFMDDPETTQQTLGTFVSKQGYGEDFLNLYLLPMSAAIWSTSPEKMLDFPAKTLLRFFHHHGFLGMDTQHPWRTVTGGAQHYVDKLLANFQGQVSLNSPVESVFQGDNEAKVTLKSGEVLRFDRVIVATHGDEALQLLKNPTPLQTQLLSPFTYEVNRATIHSDTRVMPTHKACWASWNYALEPDGSGKRQSVTHYWMNALQGLSSPTPYFVSINAPSWIDPKKIHHEFVYTHPRFTLEALKSQPLLPDLNLQSPHPSVLFCGSYFGYGFHEDAFSSAVHLCEHLLGQNPWP